MNLKKIALFSVLFMGVLFKSLSEPDNGKFLPTPELFLPNHIYFEAGGGLDFPLEFFSQGNIAMTGYGGSFFVGLGYNWSGWLMGLEYTHDQWGEGKGTYSLMQNFNNNILEFKLRRILSKKSISWLPSWLEVIPGLGAGVNFITTDYYPSKKAKDEGRMNSVSLFADGANCFFYDASLEFSFFLGTDMIIPFAGIDYNAFYDTSIGGGFAGFARAYLGLRLYPLGVVNDVKRLYEKHREEKLAAQKKIEEEVPPEKEVESLNPALTLSVTPGEFFTPDDDGISDTAKVMPELTGVTENPSSWKIEILDPQKHSFRTWEGKGKLPSSLVWDGKSDSGELVFSQNTYTVNVTVNLSEKDAALSGKKELSSRATIKTGILMIVIIPDKQWKIIVNTIHFDPDRATFDMIPDWQQKENQETLDSIVSQIRQHGNVSILIEGYANNVTNTEREDREELVPLSKLRAKAILEMLAQRGLDKSSLTAEGKGGANPIAAWKDHDNWWKNRRVEFIVTKE